MLVRASKPQCPTLNPNLQTPDRELGIALLEYQIKTLTPQAVLTYVSHSLNSSKGGYTGDYIGDYYRGY